MFSNPDRTVSNPHFCGIFIPKMASGTRDKLTALDLRCRTMLEVGVVFLEKES